MLFSASCSSLNLENKKIQFQLASKAIIHMNMLSSYGWKAVLTLHLNKTFQIETPTCSN